VITGTWKIDLLIVATTRSSRNPSADTALLVDRRVLE